MYIEFTGCSGSGKTMISGRVIEALEGGGEQVVSVHPDHFSVLGPVLARLRHPTTQNLVLDINGLVRNSVSAESRRFLCFADAMLRRHAESLYWRLNRFRSVNRKLGVHHLLSARPRRTFAIVDEGMIHAAQNLFAYIDSFPAEQEIAAFAERVPLPDAIVYVRAPLDTIITRTLYRHDSPLRESEDRVVRFLKNGSKVLDKLFAQERLKARTIVLDNDRDSPETVDRLAHEAINRIKEMRDRA